MSQQPPHHILAPHNSLASETEDSEYAENSQQTVPSEASTEGVMSPALTAAELWRHDHLFASHRENERNLDSVGPVVPFGWCMLVDKATTRGERGVPLHKRQGYIQLSFDGFNHVCLVSLSLSLCDLSVEYLPQGGASASSGCHCGHQAAPRHQAWRPVICATTPAAKSRGTSTGSPRTPTTPERGVESGCRVHIMWAVER